jgi:LysR family transcriptional activator of nhaA
MMPTIGLAYDASALSGVNLNHLVYFWAVARAGSVTAAARALGVSQPAVSEQVKKLERRLGASLFRRVPRGVELTSAGERVMRYAEEVAGICADLLRSVPVGHGVAERPLVTGTADSVPKHITQSVLGGLLRARPSLRVVCREWRVDQLLSELSMYRMDLVLTDAPTVSGQSGHMISYSAGRAPIGLAAVPRLARELAPGFPRSLHGAPFLCPPQGTPLRDILDRWFALRRIRPRVVVEAEDRGLLREFAEAGVGVAPVVVAGEKGRGRGGVTEIGTLGGAYEEYFAVVINHPRQHSAIELLRAHLQGAAGPHPAGAGPRRAPRKRR